MSRRAVWPEALLLALAFYATGRLGLLLAIPPGFATAVWPPAGIALAAILARGARLWPGVLAGSLAVNLEIALGQPAAGPAAWLCALGIGAGATAQALLSAALVRRFVAQPLELARDTDILRFFLFGGVVGCLVNASWSVLLLALSGSISWDAAPFSWCTWWIGDGVGVLIVAPLVLTWIGEPRAVWARRRVTLALPLLLMVVVVVVLFIRVRALEEARLRADFAARTSSIGLAFDRKVRDTVEILRSVDDLYAVQPDVDARTFAVYTRRVLSRHRGLQAISWNPRVPAAGRSGFERSTGIRLLEKDPDGDLVPAGERDSYVPVRFIEPDEGNRDALGFDVRSEPVRRAALDRARETGDVVATGRLRLVQQTSDEPALLVFHPRYRAGAPASTPGERRAALAGYIAGVVRLDALMAEAFAALNRDGLGLSLHDVGGHAPALLWSRPAPAAAGGAGSGPVLAAEHRLDVAGLPWLLRTEADAGYLKRGGALGAWVVLAGGLLFSGLLGAFLLTATGRATLIERLGAERAAELSRMNASLETEIAERKAAQASLSKKEGELVHARKMEAIGRLAGGVAHDFNNLLTAILGYTHLLLERETPASPHRADLDEIRKASERAAQLTAQLLAFGRKQVLKPSVLDVNGVVTDMNKMLRRVIGEDIELVTAFRHDVGRIKADRGQIEQVILNLALNARDAMARGGRLTIETRNFTADGAADPGELALPPDLRPGAYVAVSVADTGAGMDEDTLSRLFEPFFTTKEQGKGTGLGLSTAYGIVSQSGGYIGVRSRRGEGSTFTIFLPRVDENLSDGRLKAAAEPASAGVETLLLVEDEDVVRRLSSVVLRQKGYTVLEAVNGEDALRVLGGHPGRIDLLITDMIMPKMGGRELAHQMALLRPEVKVLYISGYAETAIIHHGLLGENTFFLSKPFTPLALARKVREILESVAEKR